MAHLFILMASRSAVPENDFGGIGLGFIDTSKIMKPVEKQGGERETDHEASHAFDYGQHDGCPGSPVTIWQVVLCRLPETLMKSA